jgi:hypothetical protein
LHLEFVVTLQSRRKQNIAAFPSISRILPTNAMNEIIDGRFERVENALAKLINSISAYNPSPALATDLVTADAELSQGLEQCVPCLLCSFPKAVLIML